MKNRIQITVIALLLAVVGLVASAAATTIGLTGNTSISIELPNELSYYKIDQPDGYGIPATNSAQVGGYLDYPGFNTKQIDADSGVERDGTAMAQAVGRMASNEFIYDPNNNIGFFSTTEALQTPVTDFSAQYTENRMGLHFYVSADSTGPYDFNITVDYWQRVLTWAQSSGPAPLESGWYSSLNAYLFQDEEETALDSSSVILLSQVMDVFSSPSGNESYSGSTSLSLSQVQLTEGWHTLYISDYTKQYSVTPVPLPATFHLMATGLIALGFIKRRSRNNRG